KIPEVDIARTTDEIWLPKLMVEAGLAPSSSEAVRLIRQGAVQVDGAPVTNKDHHVSTARPLVIQRGKRRFVRVRFR
ncbi:MAG: S4 domain-containing protein, partial [Gemmatimonadales bacterium]